MSAATDKHHALRSALARNDFSQGKLNFASFAVDVAMLLAERDELAAAPAAAKPALTDEQIKNILLAHGFTIKAGLSDLKPYVYEAVRAILAAAGSNITGAQP